MPDGFGGFDLYYSDMEGDTAWGKPVNLGKDINSELDEMYPYIDSDTLYFSSKGNKGLGDTKRSFNKLTSLAQDLQSHNSGINKLSADQLKSIENNYKIARFPAKWIERKKGQSRFTILKWSLDYLYWYFYAFKIKLYKNEKK